MRFFMSIERGTTSHRGTEAQRKRASALRASVPLCENSSFLFQSRREFLRDAFCGFGSLALASLWNDSAKANPLAAKASPREAKAKSVIFLFMAGGPSHI